MPKLTPGDGLENTHQREERFNNRFNNPYVVIAQDMEALRQQNEALKNELSQERTKRSKLDILIATHFVNETTILKLKEENTKLKQENQNLKTAYLELLGKKTCEEIAKVVKKRNQKKKR